MSETKEVLDRFYTEGAAYQPYFKAISSFTNIFETPNPKGLNASSINVKATSTGVKPYCLTTTSKGSLFREMLKSSL